jgi:uncharacterized protein
VSAALRLLAAAAAFLAVAGCAGGQEETAAPPPAAAATTTSLERGTAVIETRDGETRVEVEIAETDADRQRGLMGRVALPRQAGMVFLFDGETEGGFWMKDTLIPLSIAFFDEGGEILRILDMEPCEADPCEVYDPGVAYHGALEVNRGMFRTWGVRRGDVITVERA